MVRIVSGENGCMNIHPATVRQRVEKDRDQIQEEFTGPAMSQGIRNHHIRPPGKIHSYLSESLIHRNNRESVSPDAAPVAQCLTEGFAHADSYVLNRVMVVHVQIATGRDLEIEKPMPCHVIEHMIEESDACFNGPVPGAVKAKPDQNIGFRCLARKLRCSHSLHPLPKGLSYTKHPNTVTTAEAGVQIMLERLDSCSRLRGNDVLSPE